MNTNMEFWGYPRTADSAGIRNHLLILPTVVCANRVAQLISQAVPGAVALQHPFGCSQMGDDARQTARVLRGMGANANVGGVIVIGLGCETVAAEGVAESIAALGKPVEMLKIQDLGGSDQALRAGAHLTHQLAQKLTQARREPCSLAQITIGIHCADPDDTVITWANPVVGKVCDMLVTRQARVMFAEIPELLAAAEELRAMAENPWLAEQINRLLEEWKERLMHGDRRIWHLPTTDNPGLPARSTACGSLAKAGAGPIQEVLTYGQAPQRKGLTLMDTPTNPAESLTGMVAGGAQLILLTTGSGALIGSPIAPVISISANPAVLSSLKEHTDLDLTPLLSGGLSLDAAALHLRDLALQVAGGEETQTERLGYRDFAINRIGPTV
ncbi:MAG: UxaA family hydrolase [Firmicutes bacterium]|nr:UxaA family hydrolase [Bacillota bacterium]